MQDIDRLPFFRPLSPEALSGLTPLMRWRRLGPGETLLDAGDPAEDVYFVAEGELRVVARGRGGQEMILNELGPGSLFGEIAAVDGGGRSAGIVALTRARICSVPAGPFMALALSSPEASLHLMRQLTALVREKEARLLELAVLPVRGRLIALLLRLARPRPGTRERIVTPPRPHHELASRIGTRREVVSRCLAQLQREGLTELMKGGLVLRQPEALERELASAWEAARGEPPD